MKVRNLLRTLAALFISVAAYAQPNFINPIPIPPLLDAGADTIRLEMQMHFDHKFNPNDPTDSLLNGKSNQPGIQAWSYNLAGDSTMSILGPTLLWHSGHQTNIKVTNKLIQPTTSHWHGAEVPAHMDGGPHQPIAVDSTWEVNFLNLDSASTMWYHPHYHNNTYPQVQLGLSGMIISVEDNDPINANFPRTYGVDDFPIILGDLSMTNDTINQTTGEYIYAIDTTKSKRPINIVNGVTNPYLEVPAHRIRLRILNGSTRKGIQYAIANSLAEQNVSNMEDFMLVATDGGYTVKPDTMKTILIGPGARTEILLDLTNYIPGDVVYLRNMKQWMGGDIVGSPNGNAMDTTTGEAFLQLRIVPDPIGYTPVDVVPAYTSSWTPDVIDTTGIDRYRYKTFEGQGQGQGFTIDGVPMNMMVINDTICVGAKEVWSIKNNTPVSHPFHIHKIFFRILSIDSAGTYIDLEERGLNGPKDDILVRKDWNVRFLGKFDHYPNAIQHNLSYMYHCHILTHEDAQGGGMMHQFVVTDDPLCMVGLNEKELNDFTLYPNPANGELNLVGNSQGNSTIRIIDLNGSVLKVQELVAFDGEEQINIEGLVSGFYLVEWTNERGTVSKRLILE